MSTAFTTLVAEADAAFTALKGGWKVPAGTSDKALRIATSQHRQALMGSALFEIEQYGKLTAASLSMEYFCTPEFAKGLLEDMVEAGELDFEDGHFHRFYTAAA